MGRIKSPLRHRSEGMNGRIHSGQASSRGYDSSELSHESESESQHESN